MAEAEGILAEELRRVRADQPFADECGQPRRHLRPVRCERLDGAAVEDLALDRTPLEHAPLGRFELVQARAEQRPQRGRHDDVAAPVAGDGEHLLDEEWVSARGACDLVAQLGGDLLRDELVDVFVSQRLEPERHRPGGAALGELRPRHAEQQDRGTRGQERDVLDQIQERLLAPLDVVEDDHDRPFCRGLLQRLAERPGDLLRGCRSLRLAQQRPDRLRGGLFGGPQVELLQYLDDRPVRDPLPIGRAAATHDRRVDGSQSLRGEPGLADAGIADDRHQLAALLRPYALPRLPQDPELALTAHEQLPVPALRRIAHPQQPIGGNRVGLALQLERFDRLDVSCVSDERQCRAPHQHVARLRRLLQPRRDVDRVTGRKALLSPRHHLPGHDADPPLQPELGQRVTHLRRRPYRPQRVILVQHRHAEHGHHGVADELLHAAAVPLHDRLHPLEIAREQRPQPLGIERLTQLGRAGQVAEQHRHRLALLLRPRGAATDESVRPHSSQNLAPSPFPCPQLVQISTKPP